MKLNQTEMKNNNIASIQFIVKGLKFDLSDKGAVFDIEEFGSSYGYTQWNATVTNVNSLGFLRTKFGIGAHLKAEIKQGNNGFSFLQITGVGDADIEAPLEVRQEGNKPIVTSLNWPSQPGVPGGGVGESNIHENAEDDTIGPSQPNSYPNNNTQIDIEGVVIERCYNLMKAFQTDPRGLEIIEWLGEDLFKKEFCTTMRGLLVTVFGTIRQYTPTDSVPSDDEIDAAIMELKEMANN